MDRRERNHKWFDTFDSKKMVVTLIVNDKEVELSVKYEVCGTCEGKGTHVNPSIDSHGLTAEDFEEQGPDFREDYFSGMYDVTCAECHGEKIVPVLSDNVTAAEQLLVEDRIRDNYEYDAECEAERRMGA